MSPMDRPPEEHEQEHENDRPAPARPDRDREEERGPRGGGLPADSVRSVPSLNLEGEDNGEETW